MLHCITCLAAAIFCRGRNWAVIVVIEPALSAKFGHVWSMHGQLGHCAVIVQACSSCYLPCAMLHCIICCGRTLAVISFMARVLFAILGHVWSLRRQLVHCAVIARVLSSHYPLCAMLHCIICRVPAIICCAAAIA